MSRKSCVLLVDHDKEICETMSATLELMGYEVLVETDAAEALYRFTRQPARFDIAILDYLMPDLNGLELARHLSAIRPGLPMVLVTDCLAMVTVVSARMAQVNAILEKPVTRLELLRTLRYLLSDRPAQRLRLVFSKSEQ